MDNVLIAQTPIEPSAKGWLMDDQLLVRLSRHCHTFSVLIGVPLQMIRKVTWRKLLSSEANEFAHTGLGLGTWTPAREDCSDHLTR